MKFNLLCNENVESHHDNSFINLMYFRVKFDYMKASNDAVVKSQPQLAENHEKKRKTLRFFDDCDEKTQRTEIIK